MRMPATGMTAMPTAGSTRVTSSRASTGPAAAPMAAAAHQPLRWGVIRRPAVRLATTYITRTNAATSAPFSITQAITAATAAS